MDKRGWKWGFREGASEMLSQAARWVLPSRITRVSGPYAQFGSICFPRRRWNCLRTMYIGCAVMDAYVIVLCCFLGNIKLQMTVTAWPLDFLICSTSFLQVNGKGSLWCVDPEYKPNLVQALKKQPFPSALAFYTPPASPPR